MICPNCNSENRPDARFCVGCGAAINAESNAAVEQAPVEPVAAPVEPASVPANNATEAPNKEKAPK